MKHITEDIEDLAFIVSKCLINLESIEDYTSKEYIIAKMQYDHARDILQEEFDKAVTQIHCFVKPGSVTEINNSDNI